MSDEEYKRMLGLHRDLVECPRGQLYEAIEDLIDLQEIGGILNTLEDGLYDHRNDPVRQHDLACAVTEKLLMRCASMTDTATRILTRISHMEYEIIELKNCR
ncbi:hypothetical protein [Haloglycomyces albus]|uniref:hypothetical protein n=1 Tax=Haloglycomyces albus TaxID=526067 RepID=UPI0012EC2ED2|nr:hypothetical protein [Haloglycomyces albus]